jgi:Flp pilus assembly protein TadG
MMRWRATIFGDRGGAAAAEMALVAPLLVTIMFASLEIGKYFWDEHLVVKAVRDGARYAARQNFATMPCGGPATNETQIQNLVRYGKTTVTGADRPRLYYWTNNSTITVTIICYANEGAGSTPIYGGIYAARPVVPIVRVKAQVPYTPIVGSIGFQANGLRLNAYSESAVMGI